jgi:hypothetical protein
MEHKESELSQWFNCLPWQNGIYHQLCGLRKDVGFQKYQDGKWGAWSDTYEEAEKSEVYYHHHDEKWRGLSYDPSLPKKLARRTDPATSKEAAAKIVKSGALKSHCAKIRACLVEHGRMTPSEIAAKLKMRRSSVFRRMSDLKRDGFASRTGEKRGGQSVWNAI